MIDERLKAANITNAAKAAGAAVKRYLPKVIILSRQPLIPYEPNQMSCEVNQMTYEERVRREGWLGWTTFGHTRMDLKPRQ